MIYTFTLSDGITTLADVPVLENNGLNSQSTPREILDIKFDTGSNKFVLDGDLTARFVAGFLFDVTNSPYAGTYTVLGSVLTVDGNTEITVTSIVPNPLTIVGVDVAGSKWVIEGVDNGPCLFYPGSSISVSGNSFPGANTSYTVMSALSSQPHAIIGVVTGINGTVTVTGDQTGSFLTGKSFRISANNGNGNGTYTVQTAVFGAGNTVITVTGTIPVGTTISGLVTPTPAVAYVTVLPGTIPIGTGNTGNLVPPAPVSYPLATAPVVNLISAGQYQIMWRISGNHASKFTTGCHLAVRSNSFFEYQQFNIVSATYNAPNTEIVVGFSSQVTPTPDGTGSLLYPLPLSPYGYIQYDTPVSSSLKLIGKGSPYYNDTTTWGQALQDNQIHMLENFANVLPPVAPLSGQQWYNPSAPGLFLFGSTKYTIIQVTTGLNGTITISGAHNSDIGIQPGKDFFIYNNTGLGNVTVKYTVLSVALNGGDTDIVVTGTIPGAATNNGTLFSSDDWHNIVTTGMPVQSNIDMNNHSITNLTNPVASGDAVNKQYVDSLANGIVWLQPVLDPNVFDDTLSAPPVIDSTIPLHKTYIVKAPGTGAWAGKDGHAMCYDSSTLSWIDILGRAVQIGDRFGVFIEPEPADPLVNKAQGGLLGNDGRIATVATTSPSLTWSFYNPTEPDAFTVVGSSPLPPAPNIIDRSPHYGHSYTFRGIAPALGNNTGFGSVYDWIEFSGGAGGGGGPSSTALSSITAATTSNSINSGDNDQTWNWSLSSIAKSALKISENIASTSGGSSQILVDIGTIAASTASPLRVSAQGNAALTVDASGNVSCPIGVWVGNGVGVFGWGTPGGYTDCIVGDTSAHTVSIQANSAIRGVFSSSGLAITGALSATGNTTLGDASTDTVTVNGYIGVGGAANSSIGLNVANTALTGVNQYGIANNVTGNASGTTGLTGFYSAINTAASAYTIANAYNLFVAPGSLGSGSAITNLYGVYVSDLTIGATNIGIRSQVSSGANKWNIYASGTANNAFAGNVRIGSTVAPAVALDVTGEISTTSNMIVSGQLRMKDSGGTARSVLDLTSDNLVIATGTATGARKISFLTEGIEQVNIDATGTLNANYALNVSGNVTLGDASTDTVTVNGYMGVGGAGSAAIGVYQRNTALTGTGQHGFYAETIGTSAATTSVAGLTVVPGTAAAAFTCGNVYGISVTNASKGAGSTITTQTGLRITDQTQGATNYGITSAVSSGANKWNMYAQGTATNYLEGSTGIGTNAPEAKLHVLAGSAGTVTALGSSSAVFEHSGTNYVSILAPDANVAGVCFGSPSDSFGAIVAWQHNSNLMTIGTQNAGDSVSIVTGSNVEALRIDSTSNVLVTGPGGLGYGTGSGGAVTQATSRTTGVTLNKTNGAITLVSAAGSASWQSFTVTNSTVAATDTIKVCQKSGTDLYMTHVTAVAAGSFRITFATTGGTTTEQPVFNFAVIKAVTA